MPKSMTVPTKVEAILVSRATAQVMYHYSKMAQRPVKDSEEPKPAGPDIHGAKCINVFYIEDMRVQCQNPVMPSLVHGWLCEDCYHEQHKAIRNRNREAKHEAALDD